MPEVEMWQIIVDTLAKRYGWTLSEMSDNMYWEDIYEFYEYACNMDLLEKNERLRFDFMIHAQSKQALNSWKDLPLPYPDRRWTPPQKARPLAPKFLKHSKQDKMTDRRQQRFDYVKRRIEESDKRAAEELNEHYYGKDQSKWPKNG